MKPAAFGWISLAQSVRGLSVPCVRTCRKCFPAAFCSAASATSRSLNFELVGGLFPAAIIQRRLQPRAEAADALVARLRKIISVRHNPAIRRATVADVNQVAVAVLDHAHNLLQTRGIHGGGRAAAGIRLEPQAELIASDVVAAAGKQQDVEAGLFQQCFNPLPFLHAEHLLDGITVMRRVQNLHAGNVLQMIDHAAAGEKNFRIIKPRIAVGDDARRRSQRSRPRFQVLEIGRNPRLAFARGQLFHRTPGGFERSQIILPGL